MPSQSSRRTVVTPFTIAVIVIALAFVALAVFWFSDGHTKRAVAALVVAAVVGGGAGYSAYMGY
jgi:drug/metabolite transporter (DMT)-like permease